MDVQAFTQAVFVFLGSITAINIVINFLQLCFKEFSGCSIMDGESQKKKGIVSNGCTDKNRWESYSAGRR